MKLTENLKESCLNPRVVFFFSKKEEWRNAASVLKGFFKVLSFESFPVKIFHTQRPAGAQKSFTNLNSGIGNGIPTNLFNYSLMSCCLN